ncbi:MAG: manganese efflux pump MntP family protein [Candidatus Coproplasma sp.]
MILTVLLTGVSLAMDAFAVSICDGMVYRGISKRKGILIPLTFGLFQAIMPIIGFYIGLAFQQFEFFDSIDHWIGFALLFLIGGKMMYDGIKELRSDEEAENELKSYSLPTILLQGVATSIDALFVGFTFNTLLAVECVTNIQAWAWLSVGIIGVVTFIISLVGLIIGNRFGKLFQKKACVAEIIGGIILVLLGIKMLLSGYGIINF